MLASFRICHYRASQVEKVKGMAIENRLNDEREGVEVFADTLSQLIMLGRLCVLQLWINRLLQIV